VRPGGGLPTRTVRSNHDDASRGGEGPARSPEFATLATIEPDGRPHLSVIWVGRDGDDTLFSTVHGRRKTANLQRDPRVTLLVYPKDDPYTYLEIRGTAELAEDPERAYIEEMSQKYLGRTCPWHTPQQQRIVVRVKPEKVVWHD
jgi:PPOX class probable F420-dependent enzyme